MCGLGGIINKDFKPFDYSTFCTIGISNDSRGGDSCGIFIDGNYDYGIGKTKLFSHYFQNSKLLESTTKSKIALVHCRKASIGVIDRSTAQPVIITENKKVKYVLMHNGTISNYKSLAEKYIPNIDITGMTDSQVMARIFYYKGYNVLKEYAGSAVFVIVDYRKDKPEVLLFKGASKEYSWDKDLQEERPLYFCIDKDKQELVFSSIYTYLLALRPECITYTARCNELLRFNGKALVTIAEYDRSKVTKWGINNQYDNYLSQYLSVDLNKNLYSYRGNLSFGKYLLDDIGRVGKGTEIYFFEGVALKNRECYDFLLGLLRDSKLKLAEFCKVYENVIRYLSVDQVFPKDKLWY